MPTPLNLFPVRVPIGRFTDKAGNVYDVLMTPEYARALADLMVRVGGSSSFSMGELATLSMSTANEGPKVAALQQQIEQLHAELAAAAQMNARLDQLEKLVRDLAQDRAPASTAQVAKLTREVKDFGRFVASYGPTPTDWEHPGKIGARSANSATFTAVTATTVNKVTIVQPATSAGIQIADLRTFKCNNNITLSGNDGTTLNIAAGGTLGSAAFQNTSAFAARTNTALAVAATDPASTQALANSMRAVLISVGIGT